jgi:hypothetical protein
MSIELRWHIVCALWSVLGLMIAGASLDFLTMDLRLELKESWDTKLLDQSAWMVL